MERYKTLNFVLFIILLINLELFAGTGRRRGTAGAPELLIPVGSIGTALNGSYISGIKGIEAIYWNPAGLAVSNHTAEAMISHQNYLADLSVNYGAVTAKLGNVGIFGLSIKTLDFGEEIVETTVENPDGTGRTFTPSFITFGLTYARSMTNRITFGTNMKVISEEIISANATGFAFDFGLQYALGGLKLGVVLKNYGPRMKFTGPKFEHEVQIPGTESGTRVESLRIETASFELPSQFELGASYTLNMNDKNSLTIMSAFHNNSFSFDSYNFGAEYSFNDRIYLRGSYSFANREGFEDKDDGFISSNEDYLFGPALGAGIKLNFNGTVVMNLDYAYRTVSMVYYRIRVVK